MQIRFIFSPKKARTCSLDLNFATKFSKCSSVHKVLNWENAYFWCMDQWHSYGIHLHMSLLRARAINYNFLPWNECRSIEILRKPGNLRWQCARPNEKVFVVFRHNSPRRLQSTFGRCKSRENFKQLFEQKWKFLGETRNGKLESFCADLNFHLALSCSCKVRWTTNGHDPNVQHDGAEMAAKI